VLTECAGNLPANPAGSERHTPKAHQGSGSRGFPRGTRRRQRFLVTVRPFQRAAAASKRRSHDSIKLHGGASARLAHSKGLWFAVTNLTNGKSPSLAHHRSGPVCRQSQAIDLSFSFLPPRGAAEGISCRGRRAGARGKFSAGVDPTAGYFTVPRWGAFPRPRQTPSVSETAQRFLLAIFIQELSDFSLGTAVFYGDRAEAGFPAEDARIKFRRATPGRGKALRRCQTTSPMGFARQGGNR